MYGYLEDSEDVESLLQCVRGLQQHIDSIHDAETEGSLEVTLSMSPNAALIELDGQELWCSNNGGMEISVEFLAALASCMLTKWAIRAKEFEIAAKRAELKGNKKSEY